MAEDKIFLYPPEKKLNILKKPYKPPFVLKAGGRRIEIADPAEFQELDEANHQVIKTCNKTRIGGGDNGPEDD